MQPTPDDPLTVAHSLDKLLVRDCVQVELIPEKKGLFLKHVEYQVTSQASGSNRNRTDKRSRRQNVQNSGFFNDLSHGDLIVNKKAMCLFVVTIREEVILIYIFLSASTASQDICLQALQ